MFTENVSAYFNSTLGFALDATFDPAGVNRAVKVLFDQPYLASEGIGGSNPTALGLPADFASSCIGKTLVINATNYIIRRREYETPDGAIVRLQLEG